MNTGSGLWPLPTCISRPLQSHVPSSAPKRVLNLAPKVSTIRVPAHLLRTVVVAFRYQEVRSNVSPQLAGMASVARLVLAAQSICRKPRDPPGLQRQDGPFLRI